MPRIDRTTYHKRTPLRTATALVASLSLLVPSITAPAMAQTADEILADCTAQFEGDAEGLANCVADRSGEAVDAEADVEAEAEAEAEVEAEAEEPGAPGEAGSPGEAESPEAQVEGDAEAAAAEAEAAEAQAEADARAEAEAEAEAAEAEAAAAEEDAATEADAAEDEAAAETQSLEEALEEDAAEAEGGAEAEAEAEVDAETQSLEEVLEEDAAEAEGGTEAEAEAAEDDAAAEAEAEGGTEAEAEADAETQSLEEALEEDAAEAESETTEAEEENGAEALQDEEAAEADSEAETETEADASAEADGEAVETDETPLVESETESEIADEVAAQPEPELTEEQETARDQASQALEALTGGAGTAAAAADDDAEADEVEERTVEEGDVRTSDEDFETEAVVTSNDDDDDDDDGLSDNQKLALGALGALAVGTVLANRNRVVSNSGDRVVVQQEDGGLRVLKDDDALLRRSGDEVRTERFNDGSTRTTVTRPDGSQIVTIRDASLRVLRRKLVQTDGTEYALIDDTTEFEPVDISSLPDPIVSSRSGDSEEDELRAALEREQGLDRRFSLAQVRNIPEVRALAPAFEVNTVTFASGSAAITPEQAGNLSGLAREVIAAIEENPREIFLIEGHTDAVGDAAYNLSLSDRRAETLALALNEYFDVPVENMVVQGYGEQFLKVQTQADEEANRRATVRQITGLLQTAAAN